MNILSKCVAVSFAGFLIGLTITGCQTYTEMSAADQQSALRAHSDKCADFGFKKGTNAHSECVRNSVEQSDDNVLLNRRAFIYGTT